MRSDHPERDNDPATIGIKLSTPSGDVGEWVGHPRSERCLRRLHNDSGESPGNLSLRNLPGMGCIKSPAPRALAAANVLPLRAISDIKYILFFFALVRVVTDRVRVIKRSILKLWEIGPGRHLRGANSLASP